MLMLIDTYDMADTVGYRIRLAAFWNGTNEAQLARDLDMTPQGLNKLVRGETPGNTDLGDGESRLQKIARILDVPVQWLTSGHPAQPWEAAVREAMESVPKPKRRGRVERADEATDGPQDIAEVINHLTAQVSELEGLVRDLREDGRQKDALIQALRRGPAPQGRSSGSGPQTATR